MDESEIHYHLITQRGKETGSQSLATTATVSFEIEGYSNEEFEAEVEGLVARAWKSLREVCPAIASEIKENKKVYRVVQDEDMLDEWVKSTLFVIRTKPGEARASAETFFSDLRAWLTQPSLYLFPETKELMLRTTHEWMDNEGAIRLLNQVMVGVSQPDIPPFKIGEEAPRLSNSIPFAAAGHLPSKEDPSATEKGMEALFSLITAGETLNLPVIGYSRDPSDVHRVEINFSREQTEMILSKVNEKGLTVTDAVHAAMVLATAHISRTSSTTVDTANPTSSEANDIEEARPAPQRKHSYASYAVFGLRRYRGGPYRTDIMSVNTVAWPMVVVGDWQSFAATARAVHSYYTGIMEDPLFLESITPYLLLVRPAVSSIAPVVASSSAPALSSLGGLDDMLAPRHPAFIPAGHDVLVQGFWLATNVVDAIPACHLWSWRGTLRFNVSWNVAYHTKEGMLLFGEQVKMVLLNGLGIAAS